MNIITDLTSPNSLIVFLGLSLLGLSCGSVGTFTVLRGRSLLSDALAHAALPGVYLAFLLTGERDFRTLFLGAATTGLLSVWLVAAITNRSRIREDAAIAIVLSFMFGIGIVLSRVAQNTPHGNKAGLDDFLFGKAAGLLTTDVINIALTTTVSLITITLLCKEFALLCFDREFARAIKLPVKVIDALLTALLCACTAAALPAVGAVLVSALLIFPASTARLWTNRVGVMTTLAALCGLLATTGGTAVSIAFPHLWPETLATPPTGPTIIVCCALLFILSLATAPRLRNKTFTGPRGVETP